VAARCLHLPHNTQQGHDKGSEAHEPTRNKPPLAEGPAGAPDGLSATAGVGRGRRDRERADRVNAGGPGALQAAGRGDSSPDRRPIVRLRSHFFLSSSGRPTGDLTPRPNSRKPTLTPVAPQATGVSSLEEKNGTRMTRPSHSLSLAELGGTGFRSGS